MTIDHVSKLPNEISEIIFLNLSPTTLLECRRVSNSWKDIADNDHLWRSKFCDQKYWKYNNDDSETDSWYELYKERYLLDLNWKNDRFTRYHLCSRAYCTWCVKFFKNWIITGSDCTIIIWDCESYQGLRVLGNPDFRIFTAIEISELVKDVDIKTHFGVVWLIDINDEYLVSCSYDYSCIIWKLPDFNPIQRLIIPIERDYSPPPICGLALYNDYIVCCVDYSIMVWKLSLDDLEQHQQFNLQHILKNGSWIRLICIHNDIIYSRESEALITSWNIETGQKIQVFKYDEIACHGLNAQYLFVSENEVLTFRDLKTNEIKILPDQEEEEGLVKLSISDNKIVSINHECSSFKIWNLNDLKLFKKFKILDNENLDLLSTNSIGIDSKKLAAFTMDGDVVVYDFSENLRKKYLKYL